MDLTDLSWPQVEALSRDTPVVFPIAALEQHGHHLPLFTDSLLLGEIIRRVRGELASSVLFAPLMWLGNSEHHLDFAGTLSAAPRTYLDLLHGLGENFVRHGFRRLVFINGHGGNDVPGRQVVFELRQRFRARDDLLFLMGTYWSLGARGAKPHPELHQDAMGHACEWETSMMLRLAPHLVGAYGQAPAVEPVSSFGPASRGWTTRDRSERGHIGFPHLASAEKGERLFAGFAADVRAFLDRVVRWDGKSWNA